MAAGDIYTVAGSGTGGQSGDGGPATSAELNFPQGVAVDGSGNLLIADADNNRVRVVAETSGTFYGVAMTAGDIYTVAGIGTGGSSGDGGPATSAELNFPSRVAVDGSGNLVIADTDNNRVHVVAASTGTFYGVAMTAGDIYTVAGNGTGGYSGDGGPATSAQLAGPAGVAVDGSGNLVIADAFNNRVRGVAGGLGPCSALLAPMAIMAMHRARKLRRAISSPTRAAVPRAPAPPAPTARSRAPSRARKLRRAISSPTRAAVPRAPAPPAPTARSAGAVSCTGRLRRAISSPTRAAVPRAPAPPAPTARSRAPSRARKLRRAISSPTRAAVPRAPAPPAPTAR